jgi:hypothetical protein
MNIFLLLLLFLSLAATVISSLSLYYNFNPPIKPDDKGLLGSFFQLEPPEILDNGGILSVERYYSDIGNETVEEYTLPMGILKGQLKEIIVSDLDGDRKGLGVTLNLTNETGNVKLTEVKGELLLLWSGEKWIIIKKRRSS